AAFACDHDLVRGAERFAAEPRVDLAVVGDAELDVFLDKGIENRIGDLVGDFVRMTFGHGFTGKEVICARHRCTLLTRAGSRAAPALAECFLQRPQARSRCGQSWAIALVVVALRDQATSAVAICSTRSTIRRRSLASLMPMNALVKARPSDVARKSET